MTASRFLPVFAPAVLTLLLAAVANAQLPSPAATPERRLVPSRKNAAAEDLESLVLALGLDPRREESSAEHPSKEDVDAYQGAGFGSWLDTQLKSADDSISSVPANIQSYLEKRQQTVWRVTALLERDVPQWDSDPRADPRDLSGLRLAIPLNRILLADTLVEEHAGNHSGAGNLLEASWSLFRSFSRQPDLTSQLMAVAFVKLQTGALRKMSDPSVAWLDRVSGDEPWRRMLDAVEALPLSSVREGDAPMERIRGAQARAWRAVTDRLREHSPCEVSKLSSEEIWRPALEEIERLIAGGVDPSLKIFSNIAVPNITGAIRRAGRLLVDRELTAKILELRQEKAASREGRWPEKLLDGDSRVCPGAAYEYQTRGAAMAIRFKGAIDDPAAPALELPLSFEVRAPRPTPTPTRPRRPTVTPRSRP